jgi:hypothetical protein
MFSMTSNLDAKRHWRLQTLLLLSFGRKIPYRRAACLPNLECFQCSLTVSSLPCVISKIKLAQIAVQVSPAYMMIDAVNAALQKRKVAFDAVSRDAHTFLASDVF